MNTVKYNEDNIENKITLLPSLLKMFPMFQMCFWYDTENVEYCIVETIDIRCNNCGEETGSSMKNMNTNYKEIITKSVLNKMLQHVGMS